MIGSKKDINKTYDDDEDSVGIVPPPPPPHRIGTTASAFMKFIQSI